MPKSLVVAALAALISLALLSPAVLAHSRPLRFEPAPGAVLSSAPAQVKGWFSSDLRRDPNWTFLRVTDEQGRRVDSGEAVLDATRRQMTVQLQPSLPPGRYLMTWRSFDDADGAIFGDCYLFFVGQAAADAAVAANLRLDGGSTCQRIDVSARDGTPVPGQTPSAASVTPVAADGHSDEADATHEESDGSGVSVFVLILGVLAGIAVGGVGVRLLGPRA